MAQPPVPQQDVDLWKIYANKIREQYLQGSTLGDTNKMFIPLLNASGPMVGSGIAGTTTSYEIGNIGDSLVTYNNPMFTTAGDKYSRKVFDYLNSVQLATQGSAGNLQVLKAKKKAVDEAQAAYDKTFDDASTRFDKMNKDPNVEFSAWVTRGYPSLASKDSALKGAMNDYDQISSIVFGPGYVSLQTDKANMRDAINPIGPTTFNMEVNPPLFGADVKAAGKRYLPLYTIDSSYKTAVQNWIDTFNDPTRKDASVQFSNSDSNKYSWSSVGHQEWKANSSISYLPFFSIDYNGSGSKDSEEIHANDQNASIDVTIKAAGIQPFKVASGNWDVGDIKKKYPNLLPESSKSLWDPMFRITDIVVGYAVSMEIKLDQGLYDKVTSKLKEAQSHSGGAGVTFFGFRIDIGGSGDYSTSNETDYSNVQTHNETCTISIPASNSTIPTLMAVLATEVAPANS